MSFFAALERGSGGEFVTDFWPMPPFNAVKIVAHSVERPDWAEDVEFKRRGRDNLHKTNGVPMRRILSEMLARRAALFVFGLLAMASAGCSITAPVYDSPDTIAAVRHTTDDPPSLTLYTSVNEKSGFGEHTALMINGSQRVIYDPAGRFKHPDVRENGDVLYGVTPEVLAAYNAHQSGGHYTALTQYIEVPADVAEAAIVAAEAQGVSSDGLCTVNTSQILKQLKGFENIETAIWPSNLMWNFAERSGVTVARQYD